MTDQMRCRVSALTGGHLVSVAGEIDMATAPRLAETLVQFANGSVTVDLTDVTFIDCSGLTALIAAQRHVERRRGQLFVRGVNPITRKLFEMTGLATLLCATGVGTELAEEEATCQSSIGAPSAWRSTSE
jgi:anti-sigma B factor antagonist